MAISFLPSSTIFGPSALMDSPYPPSPLVVGLSPSCSRLSSIFAFFPQGRAPLDGWMEGHQATRKNSDPSQDHLIGETASGKMLVPANYLLIFCPHLLFLVGEAIVCREYCQPQNGRKEGMVSSIFWPRLLWATNCRRPPLLPNSHPHSPSLSILFPFFLPQSANILGQKMRPTAMMGWVDHSHPFLAGCALRSKRQLSAIGGGKLAAPSPIEGGPIPTASAGDLWGNGWAKRKGDGRFGDGLGKRRKRRRGWDGWLMSAGTPAIHSMMGGPTKRSICEMAKINSIQIYIKNLINSSISFQLIIDDNIEPSKMIEERKDDEDVGER